MAEKYTPMMMQYLKVKENYQDAILFYRIGDFYEMFFDDAKVASKELDLILTGKNAGVEERVPMCGIPHHASSSYIQRLVSRGYKVAICEQVQDPKEAIGIVEREVIKIITPGTIVDEIQDEKNAVYLASIVDGYTKYYLSYIEMSTGETFVEMVNHQTPALLQALLRHHVKEVVVEPGFNRKVIETIQEYQIVFSTMENTTLSKAYQHFAHDLQDPWQIASFGLMMNYVENTQKHIVEHIQPAKLLWQIPSLKMDYATRVNLELITPLHEHGKAMTLWTFLDECQSAMGSRELKRWIEMPLVDQVMIEERYDQIAWLHEHFLQSDTLRNALKNIYDLQRLIAKIVMNSCSPLDMLRFGKTLQQVPLILKQLDAPCFQMYTQVDPLPELCQMIMEALVENPPATIGDGGVFKDGYHDELDQARQIQNHGQEFIAALEAKEKEKTGIKTLKIGYNRVFGYYIEISKMAAKEVQDEWGYIRKQTLTNNERFITQELKEKEDAILHAQENALRIEKQLFYELMEEVKKHTHALQQLADVLAKIDVIVNLAYVSKKYGYVRPTFAEQFKLIKGRHPILDAMMKKVKYVANDVIFQDHQTIALITGPNMGGKSTYMRQVALIIIMAQMGCYVPCQSAQLPIFDQIFTRIGASDDIMSGQSTFMVEMMEASYALQNATERSLIILDEIGRGTSTYDGMAIAQSMIEYIATCIRAKTMFSTHYHELVTMADQMDGIFNLHVGVQEKNDEITFLYKVLEGPASQSYGIHVARLAGLPETLLTRADQLQKELESKKRNVQQSLSFIEMHKEDPKLIQMKEQISQLPMDDLSPKQAWEILENIQRELKYGK